MTKTIHLEKESAPIEVRAEQQQEKEIKLLGRQLKKDGLILWEYNTNTKELCRAKFHKQDVELTSLEVADLQVRHKVVMENDCIYFQALNIKNAIRKLKQAGYEIPKPISSPKP